MRETSNVELKMKKLIILSVTLAAAWQTYGQGTVVFQNASASAVSNGLAGGRVAAGQTFNAALYYLQDEGQASVTTADFNAGLASGKASIISSNRTGFQAAGIYVGGTRSAPTPTPGATGWFQVRAWETAFGNTYEEAVANPTPQGGRLALVGTSNIIKVDTGDPTTVPPGTAGTLTGNGISWFLVTPVPEPSVIGLGVLGIGALLLLRRRK
jgi:hypothetical protein